MQNLWQKTVFPTTSQRRLTAKTACKMFEIRDMLIMSWNKLEFPSKKINVEICKREPWEPKVNRTKRVNPTVFHSWISDLLFCFIVVSIRVNHVRNPARGKASSFSHSLSIDDRRLNILSSDFLGTFLLLELAEVVDFLRGLDCVRNVFKPGVFFSTNRWIFLLTPTLVGYVIMGDDIVPST